jgi:hypothetical protein
MQKDSRHEAPQELPLNFYDHNWYKCLTNSEVKELGIQDEMDIPDITMA